jgi:hypothetical protein
MVLGQVIGEKLQSDKAAETGVLGFIDDAHAATAELLHDSIVRDCLVEQSVPHALAAMLRRDRCEVKKIGGNWDRNCRASLDRTADGGCPHVVHCYSPNIVDY